MRKEDPVRFVTIRWGNFTHTKIENSRDLNLLNVITCDVSVAQKKKTTIGFHGRSQEMYQLYYCIAYEIYIWQFDNPPA